LKATFLKSLQSWSGLKYQPEDPWTFDIKRRSGRAMSSQACDHFSSDERRWLYHFNSIHRPDESKDTHKVPLKNRQFVESERKIETETTPPYRKAQQFSKT
jgi:hypothetical protein